MISHPNSSCRQFNSFPASKRRRNWIKSWTEAGEKHSFIKSLRRKALVDLARHLFFNCVLVPGTFSRGRNGSCLQVMRGRGVHTQNKLKNSGRSMSPRGERSLPCRRKEAIHDFRFLCARSSATNTIRMDYYREVHQFDYKTEEAKQALLVWINSTIRDKKNITAH